MTMTVILASASAARRRLLAAAGVAVAVEPAAIDEAAVKAGLAAERASTALAATTLAELKARRVAVRHAGALVIGADQILELDGRWLDKPTDRAEARAQLAALRGRPHRLVSAAVVLRDESRLWHAADHATLHMRRFGDGFLEQYLDAAGPAVLASVGAYQLEGLGAQLFERVDGDFFTILGLPLLPLLGFLRHHGALPA